ncbi:MAG: phosphoribosylglycinamide formyltransferase [Oscillospiraceae bacterium]|nr:phosphoribosylglycinamide formyltransferase [Oscillospiraceae bacterium]
MTRIAVLVSGGGSNLQALIDAQIRDRLGGGKIVKVISSREGVYALERAQAAEISTVVVPRKGVMQEEFDAALLRELTAAQADLVVLAGFLSVVGPLVLSEYAGRIVNVHPSLLPAFGGSGMYGLRVHAAALERGVKVTGATVHLVNEVVDGGEILLQKAVDVLPGDTPETLQHRVMEQAEWLILPQAVAALTG